ncbi:TIGR02391 family protein [Halorussus pelagicus]|uniref:TIGR02391 family protein n=1 Tax=Halorussus pelagicus TaxID=2505977 RepID=UPI000FFBCFBA|nr:TIGR02391 family protein [Halorussus pelagicus]
MELSERLNREKYQSGEWAGENVARVDIGYDEGGAYLLTQGRYKKESYHGGIKSKRESTIFIYSDGINWLQEFEQVLIEARNNDTNASINKHIQDLNGQFRQKDSETELDKIIVDINSSGVHLLAFQDGDLLGTRLIPRTERLEDGEEKGNDHLKTLQSLVSQVIDSYKENHKNNSSEEVQLPFKHIDEELKARCSPSFESGQYADAAETAIQIVEERVDELTGEEFTDQYGKALMEHAFSPNNGPLTLGESDNEQTGVMLLFSGSIQGLFNPLKHRKQNPDKNRYLDNIDQRQSQNIIFLSDLLLQLIKEGVNKD